MYRWRAWRAGKVGGAVLFRGKVTAWLFRCERRPGGVPDSSFPTDDRVKDAEVAIVAANFLQTYAERLVTAQTNNGS